MHVNREGQLANITACSVNLDLVVSDRGDHGAGFVCLTVKEYSVGVDRRTNGIIITCAIRYTINSHVNGERNFLHITANTFNSHAVIANVGYRSSRYEGFAVQINGICVYYRCYCGVVNATVGNVLQVKTNSEVILICVAVCSLNYKGIIANEIDYRMVLNFFTIQNQRYNIIAIDLKAWIFLIVSKSGNLLCKSKGVFLLVSVIANDFQVMKTYCIVIRSACIGNSIDEQFCIGDCDVNHIFGGKAVNERLISICIFYNRFFGNSKAEGFFVTVCSFNLDGMISERSDFLSVVNFTIEVERCIFNRIYSNLFVEYLVTVIFNARRGDGKTITQNIIVFAEHLYCMITDSNDGCSAYICFTIQKNITLVDVWCNRSNVYRIINDIGNSRNYGNIIFLYIAANTDNS